MRWWFPGKHHRLLIRRRSDSISSTIYRLIRCHHSTIQARSRADGISNTNVGIYEHVTKIPIN